MIMMFRPLAGLLFVTIALSVSAASWDDDSHYVSLGPRNGYYIVQPDSKLFSQLGLWEAPIIDTSDRFVTATERTRSLSGSIETAS